MNVGDSGETTEVTPGATEGVLFDGMTADGSKVFFSSTEHLTHEDEAHTGADIFMWEEGHPLTLISKGTEGNAASCDPAANTAHAHWNTTGPEENCGAVAVGGGGGVASGDGTIYFLSPSLLAGTEEPQDGVRNAPNLYLARPGQPPRFVATLESTLNAPLPPKVHPFLRSFGNFENPTGVAISEAPAEAGDSYVLDDTRFFGGSVEKFDPSGNPVAGFGKNGRIEGQSARGTGTLQKGSTTIESVSATTGAFAAGQEISAAGLPEGTTIETFNSGSLQVSQPATKTSASVSLTAKKPFFEYGPPGQAVPTTIAVDNSPGGEGDLYVPDLIHRCGRQVHPVGRIHLPDRSHRSVAAAVDQANGDVYVATDSSAPGCQVYDSEGNPITSATGTGNLESASKIVKGLHTSTGVFAAGQTISGQGIESATTIAKILSGTELELSAPATETSLGAPLSVFASFATPTSRPASPSISTATSTSSTAVASDVREARPKSTNPPAPNPSNTTTPLNSSTPSRHSASPSTPKTTSTSTKATRSPSSTPPPTRSAPRSAPGSSKNGPT